MKSFLLFAVFVFTYLASVKADCPVLQIMNDCVRIKTEARDSFCITKPNEIAKCNCVYDTLIHDCYDNCPGEPSVETAKQQLEADIKAQCAAANIDPDNVPPNVYNEVIEDKSLVNNNNVGNNTNNGNAATASNQSSNANSSQNTLTSEDVAGGAETTKLCVALLIANLILATLLF